MKRLFFTCAFFIYLLGSAQMTLSERVEYSELATSKDKQLFFVDFWATWCVPCIHVSTYLNTVQEQFREELYIVSVTQENSDVVRPFLIKHPTKLAVSIDYDGQNFKKHNVRALPYGVLFNAEGKILWKGNPADFTPKIIREQLAKNKKTTPIYDFLKYASYQNEVETTLDFNGDYKIQRANNPWGSSPVVERNGDITIIKGSITQIIGYLLKVSSRQVTMKGENAQYELLIKKTVNKARQERQIAESIVKELGYKLRKEERSGQILEVRLPESTVNYWKTDQIDWGTKNSKFLVDDNQFSADNISVHDFLYKLSEVVGKPISVKNSHYANDHLFDWQMHYWFRDLMVDNLSQLGIQAQETSGNFTRYFLE